MKLPTPLVSADALRAALQGADAPLVLDASFDLADPAAGERAFAEAHVPGSRYVHLDRDLSTAKNGRNGRHPLPERAAFARTAGRLGVAPGRAVVALDRQGGPYAARLWWMLRWLGHDDVRVLDGGFPAWVAAGGASESGASAPPDAAAPPYPEKPALVERVDAGTLQRSLGTVVLVDARPGPRFRGEVEPLDAVAGHIPGALNRPHGDNLGADGRFKPVDRLRDDFQALIGARPTGEVVHSCGSGVTACHNLLAMAAAGLDGARLYAGSWSEWSSDPARPVARG